MSSKNDSNWYQNFEALKAYILERGLLPDKHVVENRALLSWAKYQRKKIKEGTLDAEKREMKQEQGRTGQCVQAPPPSGKYVILDSVEVEDHTPCRLEKKRNQ